MDAARSSLEIPPPAWGREAALSEGRRTVLEGNAVVTWALATCALIGLALVLGGVGWSALTIRLVRALRQRGR